MNLDFDDPRFLKLSVQRALLGNVTANLAALNARLEQRLVSISAFFFEEASEDDKQYVEDTAAYVMGDFPESYTLETHYALVADVNLNDPVHWTFLRAEALSFEDGKWGPPVQRPPSRPCVNLVKPQTP